MVDSPDNDSPMVKLAVAMLDDEHGITDEAWKALTLMIASYYGTRPPPPLLEKVMRSIDGCDGRVFLPDDWNAAAIRIPVIGTLKTDGQVEFNKE